MVPPISPCPSNMIEMKALRSSDSAKARRMSRLSNGGEDELTVILVETVFGSTTQTAFGACVLTSLSIGIVTSVGSVVSNWPEMKPRIALVGLGLMGDSVQSRYGR